MHKKKISNTWYSKLKEQQGQALVEYALIVALLGIAFGIALAATGPAIGNMFSNVVFQLLGQTPEGSGPEIGGPVDFWMTVTWVAEHPQLEQALPTRTPAPPSTTPTAGPSPTPTPVTPTATRIPSATPRPTNTPLDITAIAPYLDTVDNPERWRVGASVFLGTDDWCGDYYPNMTLSGTPIHKCNREINPSFRGVLNFNWQDLGPLNTWPSGNQYEQFSVRYTKPIFNTASTPVTVTFLAQYDDGMRLWLSPTAGCASPVTPGGTPSGTPAAPQVNGDPSTSCLLINDWNVGGDTASVTRILAANTGYTLVAEYVESTGPARVSVQWGTASNEADTNLAGGAPDCNWGRRESTDSSSPTFMWEEYVGGNFRQNMRCYLEFRGYVLVADSADDAAPVALAPEQILTRPEFVYWDVWDMQGTGGSTQQGWLEIAEYIELSPGVVDRAAMASNWIRVNLRQSLTTNYNWTRNVVNLMDVRGDGTATTSDNFLGKRVAFRFVMQNGNGNATRRWYIDDVQFRESNVRDFRPGMGVPSHAYQVGGQNSFWDLDTAEQRVDFIIDPGWDLTQNSVSLCCTWEDSPGGQAYTLNSESPSDSSFNAYNMRVHFLEFNGYIDVSGNTPDLEGDTGVPQLSFEQAYTLGRYTGLELQYSVTPYGVGPAVWQVVPGIDPNAPYGRIRYVRDTTDVSQGSLTLKEIALSEIPATRFRLRFAMLVHRDANLRDGWYINNIYLNRVSRPLYLDYPFSDTAELPVTDNWLLSGQWNRTTDYAHDGDYSITDSPGLDSNGNPINYPNNSAVNTLRTLWPIDFLNDSPVNLALTNRNPAGGNTQTTQATNPMLTFWFTRAINISDALHVEWRRLNENDTQWKLLWTDTSNMNTLSASTSTRARRQFAWERVEIDLRPITYAAGGDLYDDDIMFRFRLQSDGSNTDDGVYIDSVDIKDRVDTVFRLWPAGESRTVASVNYGNGTSARWFNDFDSPTWFTEWYQGGGWRPIGYSTENGLQAIHDSTLVQISAPTTPVITYNPVSPDQVQNVGWDPVLSPDPATIEVTPHQTFNVMELSTILDLRATDSAEKPTLYFWTRYHIGNLDRIVVQISEELTTSQATIDSQMASWCRNAALRQCYEHRYGWSEWTNTTFNIAGAARTQTWQRAQVNLMSYAANGTATPGRRIRIRFVLDALEDTGNFDGWYIDNISVGPRRDAVIRRIADQGFSDNARNMSNWVAEGSWGLDPELFRGVGGGPASLGAWTEYFWNCTGSQCTSPGNADSFLDARRPPAAINPTATRTVVDINYDVRTGSPRPGIINTNNIAGRWVLDTPVIGTGGVQQGDYSLITTSDDGVRIKYEEIDAAGNVIDALPNNGSPDPADPVPGVDVVAWNVIYNWSNHSRVPDLGVVSLKQDKRYRITLEWYENSSDAVIILSVGGTAFSFTDSPKQGAGPAFHDIPSVPYSNSSLILAGTLDLTGVANPIMEYYTYYEIDGSARVEISIDGGFNWTQTGFTNAIGGDTNFQSGTISNTTRVPANGDWERRRHNLTSYSGRQIMIRFRMDNQSMNTVTRSGVTTPALSRDNTNQWWQSNYNANGFYMSWWVVDIVVSD